jgi:hypothetical protein
MASQHSLSPPRLPTFPAPPDLLGIFSLGIDPLRVSVGSLSSCHLFRTDDEEGRPTPPPLGTFPGLSALPGTKPGFRKLCLN